jgi:Ni,Fe-hydrogenase III small subunit
MPEAGTLAPSDPGSPTSGLCVAAGRDALRKEVIQPQVPLRLPCYDFTPVADLTVDGCPPSEDGLAHRLRVKPTPMV